MILKHPNILECYGFTNLDGSASIVLELTEDGALDKVIHKFYEVDKVLLEEYCNNSLFYICHFSQHPWIELCK